MRSTNLFLFPLTRKGEVVLPFQDKSFFLIYLPNVQSLQQLKKQSMVLTKNDFIEQYSLKCVLHYSQLNW